MRIFFNVLICTLLILNFLIVIYFLKNTIKRYKFKNIFDYIAKKLNLPKNKKYFVVIIIIFYFALISSIVWGTILIWRINSLVYAKKFLTVMLVMYFIMLKIILNKYKDRLNPDLYKVSSISIISLLYLLILVNFGINFDIPIIMKSIYLKNFGFKKTFVVSFPIAFVASLLINIYHTYQFIIDYYKKGTKQKFNNMLSYIIIIVSFFIGMLYFYEQDLSFMNEKDVNSTFKIVDVLKIVLSSILIPILFNYVKRCTGLKSRE